MCLGPELLIGALAVSAIAAVGSGITGFVAARKQQAAQVTFQQQQARDQASFRQQVATAANQDFINKSFQENLRQRQLDVKLGKEEDRLALEASRARARSITSAGEAGLNIGGSPTIANLVNSISGDLGRANQDLNINRQFEFLQGQENIKSFRAEALSRPAGVRQFIPSPVEGPNLLGTVFGTAGQLANTFVTAAGVTRGKGTDTPETKGG